MKNARKCIYAKDVQTITGRSESASRKLLQRIKRRLRKKSYQFISLREFCDYTGLAEDEVTKTMN